MEKQVIYKDAFGNEIKVGDRVIYSCQCTLRKGRIVKFGETKVTVNPIIEGIISNGEQYPCYDRIVKYNQEGIPQF